MKSGEKIKVLIVEDSQTVRELLAYVISNDPRLCVAATVDSAEEALRYLERETVDVISMDIHLPGMNGIEGTSRIMAANPTPIVIVSVTTRTKDAAFTMEALKVGALSVVEKPVGASHPDFKAMAQRLCTQLVSMSQVKVVKQRFSDAGKLPPGPCGLPNPGPTTEPDIVECIGIVASTGGPKAVSMILNRLGPGFPIPILLVQHMTPAFLEPFVDWLDQTTPFHVQFAKEGQRPLSGHVYLAPNDRHLRLKQGRLWTEAADMVVSLYCPSGDVLLESLASDAGKSGVGVILTGMGADGVAGLAAMRAAGAYTIAEDRSTAVVYGMPSAACERGAVVESLPVDAIAERLLSLADRAGRVAS